MFEDTENFDMGAKNLQQMLKLSKSLFNSIQAGILVIDADTKKVIDVNPAAVFMIGLDRDRIVGNSCEEFLHLEEQMGYPIVNGEILDIENAEITLVREDESKAYVLVTTTSTLLDDKRILVETFVDITEQKEAEKELNSYWSRAEQMLSENVAKLKNGEI